MKPAAPTVMTSVISPIVQPIDGNTLGYRYEATNSTFANILMSYKNMLLIAQRDSCNATSVQKIADAQQDIIDFLQDKSLKWSDIERDVYAIIDSELVPRYLRGDAKRLLALLKKLTVKGDVLDTDMITLLFQNVYTAFCKPQNQSIAVLTNAPLKSTIGVQYKTDSPELKEILEIIQKLLDTQIRAGCTSPSMPPDDQLTCAHLKQGVNAEIEMLYNKLEDIPNLNKTEFEAQRARIMNVIDSNICNSNPAIEKEQIREAIRSMQAALCVA